VVPTINRVSAAFDLVVATQDCIAQSRQLRRQPSGSPAGEEIELFACRKSSGRCTACKRRPGRVASGLDPARIVRVSARASTPTVDSYSGFFDNGGGAQPAWTPILPPAAFARSNVCGLAIRLLREGERRWTPSRSAWRSASSNDACRGVELRAGDVRRRSISSGARRGWWFRRGKLGRAGVKCPGDSPCRSGEVQ